MYASGMTRVTWLKILRILASLLIGVAAMPIFALIFMFAWLLIAGDIHSHDGQAGMGPGLIGMAISPLAGIIAAVGVYWLFGRRKNISSE
jgi:hypothetical protein